MIFLILFVIFLTRTTPFSVENDSVSPPDYDIKLHNITEIECYKKNKVLFQGMCYELLTSDACRYNEWLVLDYRSAILPNPIILPKCVRKLCKDKSHYWPADGMCYSDSPEENPCPTDKELKTNVFGDGVCECITIPPHEPISNGTCYELYTRGPCKQEWVFVKLQNRVQCIFDRCHSQTQSTNKTYVFWEKTRTCYPLGDPSSPCGQKAVLKIDPIRKIPVCGLFVLATHLVDVPQSCSTDHQGNCNDKVNIQSSDEEAFVISLLVEADKKRKSKTKP